MKNFRVLLSLITQSNDFQLEQAASARVAAQDLGAELEIVYADGDTINIYYGAADCSIALARSSVRTLLKWLDANGSSERRRDQDR